MTTMTTTIRWCGDVAADLIALVDGIKATLCGESTGARTSILAPAGAGEDEGQGLRVTLHGPDLRKSLPGNGETGFLNTGRSGTYAPLAWEPGGGRSAAGDPRLNEPRRSLKSRARVNQKTENGSQWERLTVWLTRRASARLLGDIARDLAA